LTEAGRLTTQRFHPMVADAMPRRFLAKNTFLQVCYDRELGESKKRSTSTPPCAQESGLKSIAFSMQQQYADFLTRTEKTRGFMIGGLQGLKRNEVVPIRVCSGKDMIHVTCDSDESYNPDKSYSPDESYNLPSEPHDGTHQLSRSTSTSTHQDGSVPDLPDLPGAEYQYDQSVADLPEHLKAVEDCSTLMISNIPCGVLPQRLTAAIDSSGFAGKYDLLHLPGIWNKKSNMGYGFINFPKQEDAIKFAKEFDGHQFEGRSKTIVRIKPAHVQG